MGNTTGFVNNQKFECGEYTGFINHKLQEGQGRLKYLNGDIYDGNWKKGKQEGKGTLKILNGTMYVGMWKLGELHGPGTIFKREGEKLEGEFMFGKLCGTVIHTDSMGNIYTGGYKHEKYCGYGVMNYADGIVYDGYWKKGLYHGEGELKLKDGKINKGIFKRGAIKISNEDAKIIESPDVYKASNLNHRSESKPASSSKQRKSHLVKNHISRYSIKHSRIKQKTPILTNDKSYNDRLKTSQVYEAKNSHRCYDKNSINHDGLEPERSYSHEKYSDEKTSRLSYHPIKNLNLPGDYPKSPDIFSYKNIPIMKKVNHLQSLYSACYD